VHRSDAEVAVAAAEAGADVVRARFGTRLTRMAKGPMDFATDADLEAEKAILAVLRATRPADGCLGEELGGSGDTSSPRTWLIDPLCGTINFAAQTPLVGVNVALRDHGNIAVGATADPFTREVFWTDGRTAYQRHAGEDSVLAPSALSRLVEIDTDPPPAAERLRVARLLAAPAFAAAFRPRIVSTSLALAWVAAGRYAAYVTAGNVRDSVHFASGIALCRAAGCVMTGLRGQRLFTDAWGLVAAADAETHAALVGLMGGNRGAVA
jgi:myo-inositol-1(or 4)-monophosphatase